jgi:maleate isomerase
MTPLSDQLASICSHLLRDTGADRTTVRLDADELGLTVDLTAAEAVANGTPSIAADSSLDQRALDTVRWLAANRRVLVQAHFSEPPFPPPALVQLYGVNAQILAPVLDGNALVGWVSVHSTHPRLWSDDDVAAAERAVAESTICLDAALQRARSTSFADPSSDEVVPPVHAVEHHLDEFPLRAEPPERGGGGPPRRRPDQ